MIFFNCLFKKLSVTIPSITSESEDIDKSIVYMKDLKKRKKIYGICAECKKPGTGFAWCQPCNSKRFKENFENWTSIHNAGKVHKDFHSSNILYLGRTNPYIADLGMCQSANNEE